MNSDNLQVIIITGLAGAGKSTALNALEDMGFYAIDNLPVFLLESLLTQTASGKLPHRKLALVMDCRDPSFFSSFAPVVSHIKNTITIDILFLDSSEEALLRRFSQLRRQHPLAADCTIREAISLEKSRLLDLQKLATRVIDTTSLTPTDLARQLRNFFGSDDSEGRLVVNLISFGFKHGSPSETDLLWDVRFLPNPYWVPDLKPHTGLEEKVANYVLQNETSNRFFALLDPLLSFLIPEYTKGGKAQLTIAIGCTGGKHRSVAVTEKVKELLSRLNVKLFVSHRDIDKA
ncbi:MAG: RNase adapter RapZ [Pseudomonadota bacterium]